MAPTGGKGSRDQMMFDEETDAKLRKAHDLVTRYPAAFCLCVHTFAPNSSTLKEPVTSPLSSWLHST